MYSVDEKCEKDKVKLRSIVAENFEINEKIKYETLEVDFLPWRYFSLIIKKKNILRLQQLVIRALNRFTLKSEWWIIIPCNDFVNNFRFLCNNRKACLQCVDTNCFQFGVNNRWIHVDFVDAALSFDTSHPSSWSWLFCFKWCNLFEQRPWMEEDQFQTFSPLITVN